MITTYKKKRTNNNQIVPSNKRDQLVTFLNKSHEILSKLHKAATTVNTSQERLAIALKPQKQSTARRQRKSRTNGTVEMRTMDQGSHSIVRTPFGTLSFKDQALVAYMAGIHDPFNSPAFGIPYGPAMGTTAYKHTTKFLLTTGTAGFGFVVVGPRFDNGGLLLTDTFSALPPIIYSTSTFTGTSVPSILNSIPNNCTSQNYSQLPYPPTAFTGYSINNVSTNATGSLNARVSALAIRFRNSVTTVVNRGGIAQVGQALNGDPGGQTATTQNLAAQMLIKPVDTGGEWGSWKYLPTDTSDFEYSHDTLYPPTATTPISSNASPNSAVFINQLWLQQVQEAQLKNSTSQSVEALSSWDSNNPSTGFINIQDFGPLLIDPSIQAGFATSSNTNKLNASVNDHPLFLAVQAPPNTSQTYEVEVVTIVEYSGILYDNTLPPALDNVAPVHHPDVPSAAIVHAQIMRAQPDATAIHTSHTSKSGWQKFVSGVGKVVSVGKQIAPFVTAAMSVL